jgi:hypothetical protein
MGILTVIALGVLFTEIAALPAEKYHLHWNIVILSAAD